MRFLPPLVALLLLAACSSPEAAKQSAPAPAKPAEPVTGRKAFYQVYGPARMWSADVMPLRAESMPVEGITPKDGKFGAWRFTFVSQAKGKMKVFTYSVIEASASLHEGVFSLGDAAWSGPSPIAQPFYVQAFKIDSDEAVKLAESKSVEYLKKNPTKPMFLQLEFTKLYPETAWRVLWGDSVSMSDHSIYVSASSGQYLGKS
ncbi:MAG: hypothetical protein K2X03_04225 [Bryobacteraceae bacterium]|nr:hypothetical protein [Bryobacteraceae bacterium]